MISKAAAGDVATVMFATLFSEASYVQYLHIQISSSCTFKVFTINQMMIAERYIYHVDWKAHTDDANKVLMH